MLIEQLPDLMCRSDVVMIACPLTDETRGLINAENLDQMKPTAYLINVARGPIVDEAALIDVLQQRKIAGVGLDVTETEPLSEESPLWELDNVILTPHAAGGSQHRPRRTVEFFCQNLKKYFTYSFIPAPHTLFENIYQLEPGENIIINLPKLSI